MAKQKYTYQHFVPQVYLKQFASNSTSGKKEIVHVRFNHTGKFFPKNVSDICGYDDLYTIPEIVKGLTREERLIIENEFYNKRIETKYYNSYSKLVDESLIDITSLEKQELLFLVISFYFRNKIHLDNLKRTAMETVDFFKDFIGRQKLNDTNKEVFGSFNGRKYKFRAHEILKFEKDLEDVAKFDFLVGQIDGLNKIVESKMKTGISISRLVDEEFEYITSDNPISLYKINGDPARITEDDCIITLPLDNKHLITFYPENISLNPLKIGRIKSTRNDALVANLNVEKNSNDWIIGNEISIKKHETDQSFFGEETEDNLRNIEETRELSVFINHLMSYLEKSNGVRPYDLYLYTMVYEGIKRGYIIRDPNFADLVKELENKYWYQFIK